MLSIKLIIDFHINFLDYYTFSSFQFDLDRFDLINFFYLYRLRICVVVIVFELFVLNIHNV